MRCAVPGFIATDDTRFSDQFAAFEREFDVTQFDAVTLQFHLLIFAAEKFDVTAAMPTAAIAGAVYAFSGGWEKHKAAGGGLAIAPILAGNANATDINVTGNAETARLEFFIQHPHALIWQCGSIGMAFL